MACRFRSRAVHRMNACVPGFLSGPTSKLDFSLWFYRTVSRNAQGAPAGGAKVFGQKDDLTDEPQKLDDHPKEEVGLEVHLANERVANHQPVDGKVTHRV